MAVPRNLISPEPGEPRRRLVAPPSAPKLTEPKLDGTWNPAERAWSA